MNLETGEVLTVYGVHKGTRNQLELSPDEKYLLSSEMLGELHLWDVETSDEIWRINSKAVLIVNIKLSPDGKTAVSAGPDNTAILWNLDLPIELTNVLDWIANNRYVRELTCEERAKYSIEPLCGVVEGEGE
jgi:WD40 repeat protein